MAKLLKAGVLEGMDRIHNWRNRGPAGFGAVVCLLILALSAFMSPPLQAQTGENQPELPETVYEADAPPENTGGVLPSGEGERVGTAPPPPPQLTSPLIVKQMEIEEIMKRMKDITGVTVEVLGTAKGTVLDLVARDQHVEDVLDSIATKNNWVWRKLQADRYELMDQETYKTRVLADQVIRRSFPLRNISPDELEPVITELLTPDIGAVSVDLRNSQIIVTDLPNVIALIEEIIPEYDQRLTTRVFEIIDADTQEVADRLEEIKSETGRIEIDEKNKLIIVWDTFDKIKEMEQLIDVIDRDQEIYIYNLNNIGVEGATAENIVDKFIVPLTTADALLEYDVDLNKLLLRDVSAVHDKVYEVLKALDEPRKQVLIEGEVLEVSMNDNLTLGSDWTVSLDNHILPAGDDLLSFGAFGSGGDGDGGPGLSLMTFDERINWQLSAALTDSRTRVLIRPRFIVANNEEGSFEDSRNEPIQQTFFSDGVNNTSRSTGQTTIPSGLIITIIPSISNRGLVELDIDFENSTSFTVGTGVDRLVGTTEQSAQTYLIVPSGETRVIGGLIRNEVEKNINGVPVISRIPWVGWLFGSTTERNAQRNLMFFVTPTIIEEKSLIEEFRIPVNRQARIAMANKGLLPASEDINDIPEELLPFLESINPVDGYPDTMIWGSGTTGTTTTIHTGRIDGEDGPTTSARTLMNNLPGMSPEAGANLLRGEAYSSGPAGSDVVEGGVLPAMRGSVGPSGRVGVAKPKPTPVPEQPGQPQITRVNEPGEDAEAGEGAEPTDGEQPASGTLNISGSEFQLEVGSEAPPTGTETSQNPTN